MEKKNISFFSIFKYYSTFFKHLTFAISLFLICNLANDSLVDNNAFAGTQEKEPPLINDENLQIT
jgi:hypothetical protein